MSAKLPPLPVPDDLSRPYWEAAREGRLALQRCGQCRRFQHPPEIVCLACGHEDLAFEPVSGRGVIHAHSVMYDRRVYGFEDRIPYVNVVVELEEQPLLTTVANLVDAEPSQLKIGLPVEVVFERLTDDVTLPQFRLA